MKTRHFFPAIMICHIGILLLMSCGGQPQNTASDGVSFKNDDAFHQALREQAADINEVNQKAEQQRAEQQRAEIERRERMEKEYQEENRNMLKSQILETLQGTWVWSDGYRDMWSMLVFDGYEVKEYNDGVYSGGNSIRDIDLEDGKIYYGRDMYLPYVVTEDGNFRLYGDNQKRIRFRKLTSNQAKAYAQFNDHINNWHRIYKEYVNVNVYGPYSRKQALDDLNATINQLHKDLNKMGKNEVLEKQVKKLWSITSELTPY